MNTESITSIQDLRWRLAGRRSVACVPTMGALHAGHGALIDAARRESDVVVVTVFVNPIQFDRKDDYAAYSRNLAADLAFCRERHVNIVFAPNVEEMYPEPSETFIDVPELARYLCGASRPGHFRGVATVVAKLFHIVQPDAACFGEKDAQQLAVIEQMVRDLNFPIRIVRVPTVREPDGLALSSRNQRLTPEQREVAPLLFAALTQGRCSISEGERNPSAVEAQVLDMLSRVPSMRQDYVGIVDPQRLQPVEKISSEVLLAAAVWLGETRLIDNLRCSPVRVE